MKKLCKCHICGIEQEQEISDDVVIIKYYCRNCFCLKPKHKTKLTKKELKEIQLMNLRKE